MACTFTTCIFLPVDYYYDYLESSIRAACTHCKTSSIDYLGRAYMIVDCYLHRFRMCILDCRLLSCGDMSDFLLAMVM